MQKHKGMDLLFPDEALRGVLPERGDRGAKSYTHEVQP